MKENLVHQCNNLRVKSQDPNPSATPSRKQDARPSTIDYQKGLILKDVCRDQIEEPFGCRYSDNDTCWKNDRRNPLVNKLLDRPQ